jgi:hypothetical protein
MLLLAFFAGSSLTALANGGVTTWTGDGDGWRWEDPDNWDSDEVPGDTVEVYIGGDHYVQITETEAKSLDIYLDDNATLFIRQEGDLTITDADEEGIFLNASSTLVIWGTIHIDGSGCHGIEIEDDARILNRGEVTIDSTSCDGIDMEDDALIVNRGTLNISYSNDEGLELDNDAIFRNRGTLNISYINSDAIDQDDSDTEFINDGTINISFVFNEGIEVDDGVFHNTETGEINVGFVNDDYIYVQSGGEFDNHGTLNINIFVPLVPPVPQTEETPEPGDTETPEVTSLPDISSAIFVVESGDFVNYNSVNISLPDFLGTPEEQQEAAPAAGSGTGTASIASLLIGGDLMNKDCGTIDIEGPFPIYNEGNIINEGTIDLSMGDIPISPEEAPMPSLSQHTNEGYFYNDGDILSDYPFSIGPNPIDELWTKSSIGDEGENDSFSLGCDITITTSSRQRHRASTDNLAFLNQTLCGASMLTARLDGVSNGAAGIMIREGEGAENNEGTTGVSVQSSPKMFMIASRNVDVIYHGTRYNEGDQLSYTPFFTPHDRWLRVERIGNYIRAYHSSDGNFWSLFHQVYLELGECAQVGLFATSRNGDPAMAAFSNVEVTGSEQFFSAPDVPTAEAPAIHQRATVWPTPVQSQFTVEFEQATQMAGTAILRNELGQAIGQRKLEPGTWQLQWDANTLPGGLYLLEVRTEDGYREVLKVLKQ